MAEFNPDEYLQDFDPDAYLNETEPTQSIGDSIMDTVKKTGGKLAQMGSSFVETLARAPAGAVKAIGGSSSNKADFAGSLALEGLPFAPNVVEAGAGLYGTVKTLATDTGRLLRGEITPDEYRKMDDTYKAELLKAKDEYLASIDPDVRAAANVTGMLTPLKGVQSAIGAAATEAGVTTSQKAMEQIGKPGYTGSDLASDILAGGAAVAAPVVMPKVASKAVDAAQWVGRTASELPGRFQGISGESLTEFYTRPAEVQAASRTSIEGGITSRMEELIKAKQIADARVADLTEQFKEAITQQIADAGRIAKDLEAAKTEVQGLDNMFKQAQQAELAEASRTKAELSDKLKSERVARRSEVEAAGMQTQVALKSAIEEVQGASVAHQQALSKAATDQAALVDSSGVQIPITDIKRQFMEDMSKLGIPQREPVQSLKIPKEMVSEAKPGLTLEYENGLPILKTVQPKIDNIVDYSPVTYQYRDPEVNRLLDIITKAPETMNATQLLNLRRMIGDAAYKAGAGEGRMQATYGAINAVLDRTLGDQFPQLRSELSTGIKPQEQLEKLASKAESTFSRIGEKGGLTAEQGVAELGQSIGGVWTKEKLDAYLAQKAAEKALKQSPLPSSQAAVEANQALRGLREKQKFETRPATDADTILTKIIAEQRRLDEYLSGIKQQSEWPRLQAESVASQMNRPIEQLGVPVSKETTKLPEWVRNKVVDADLEGPTSKIPQVAKQMGIAPEALSSDIRAMRAREDIYGREPKAIGESALAFGLIPAIRSGIRATGSWAATAPINLRRNINKIMGSKWAQALEAAYQRSGDKGVAATHYLLQQRDPDYQKATLGEGEGNE